VSTGNKEIRKIHLGLVLAGCVCIPAFIFELTRALGGNELSWAYVFEWPLLGAYAVYMWRKLLESERGHDTNPRYLEVELPDDPDLVAWNAYLADAHAADKARESGKRAD
jgi:hypothetical protein